MSRMGYNLAKLQMKKVILLTSALLLGFAISANAQDNKSTQSPRETRTVSQRPNSQSPRETHRVDNNTEANSRRPSIAPKQQNSNNQTSPRTSALNSNNDRVQRDATKNSQYEFGKPKN